MEKQIVYLIEVRIHDKFEPISIKKNLEDALNLVVLYDKATITRIELGAEYREGLGICDHWHLRI